ncbi:hypothetical protein BTVI_04151 [Pitangus sulphuratus]|nr:hypothetical protein BTVI_04151 [Pitangus sulphuratus]
MGKTKRKAPQGKNSIVQEPQPVLTAGEEKGQLLMTFAVGGREIWGVWRSEGEHGVPIDKTNDFRLTGVQTKHHLYSVIEFLKCLVLNPVKEEVLEQVDGCQTVLCTVEAGVGVRGVQGKQKADLTRPILDAVTEANLSNREEQMEERADEGTGAVQPGEEKAPGRP